MSSQYTPDSLNLTECDKERIHLIPTIQGHGAFVAVSISDVKIHHVSENFLSFFDKEGSSRSIIGHRLNEFIDFETFSLIQKKLSRWDPKEKTLRFETSGSHPLDIYAYTISDRIVGLEFEKIVKEEEHHFSVETINNFITKMNDLKTLEELANESSRAVRLLTGMERVMIYRFYPPTMYGEVIGEDKVAHAHTFMKHRFPATDIPKPARDLYLRNKVRFIHDSHMPTHSIHPMVTGSKTAPLDMSDSRLRGVSLIHVEYLKNMGVASSFSVAIIVDNKLWGLIACHNSKPIYISHAVRSLCLTVANAFALSAPLIEKVLYQKSELTFFNRLHDIFAKLNKSQEPLDQLFREGSEVLSLFDCEGLALVSNKKVDIMGVTPLPLDLRKVWTWAMKRMEKEGKTALAIDSLPKEDPSFEDIKYQACGLICIRLSELSDSILMICRPEYLETIYWGGDPRKNIEARNYQGAINPRLSFESWTEVIKDSSKVWKNYELEGAKFFKNLIFDSLVNKEVLIHELQKKLQKN